MDKRNRPLTDEDLDQMLPGINDGYEVVKPPESYKPARNTIKHYM